MELPESKNQLNLFGYEKLFNSFVKFFQNNCLPNVILLSGLKGLGKATFAYHFINYLLTQNEENKYLIDEFKINSNNQSYKLINNNVHPNFFLLDNEINEEIKIEKVRNLIKFLSQSTDSKNLKIILIDSSEYLNLNSSNALLKSLEEPSKNTFFFIIHNDASPLTYTIKSRSVKFKIHFTNSDKKIIFEKILQNLEINLNNKNIDKFLNFDSPGNILKYLLLLKDLKFDILDNNLSSIFFLIEKYKNTNNHELLNLINLLIENYYKELSLKNTNNINDYFLNKNKITYLIDDMKKFNLDKKNLLITISGILKNEEQ